MEDYQTSEIHVLKRALKKNKSGQNVDSLKEELSKYDLIYWLFLNCLNGTLLGIIHIYYRRQQEMAERRRGLAVKEKLKSLRSEELAKV